jgi:hypothetical protein
LGWCKRRDQGLPKIGRATEAMEQQHHWASTYLDVGDAMPRKGAEAVVVYRCSNVSPNRGRRKTSCRIDPLSITVDHGLGS